MTDGHFYSTARRGLRLALVGLLFLTGCLPYSCQREANESLFPADSASRRIAQTVPADTLEPVWETTGTEAHPIAYPRTVRFLEDGALAVSDAERNSIFRFAKDGTVESEVTDPAFDVPYLIGTRGDTLVVFSAEANRVDFVAGGKRLPDQSVPVERPAQRTLAYLLATDTTLYAKVVGAETTPVVMRLNEHGDAVARTTLEGPYWHHAGFLRTWGDTLVSHSGFRPVVNLLPRDFSDGADTDTLALVGFDSPMLERRYAHAQGDADRPPLLAAAVAPVGDMLFVLNLRPGWVRIDAYGRDGRLQRRLIERHETGNRGFYPLDLDARRTADGYRFAVTVRSPEPQLAVYRWRRSPERDTVPNRAAE